MNENNNFNGQEGFNQPQQGFGQPQQGFNQPQQSFGQPQQSFGQSQQSFEQPQQGFNQPQQSFEQPQQGFGQPQNVNPVQSDFGQPQNVNQVQPDFGQPQNVNQVQPDFGQSQNVNQVQPDFGQQQSGFGVQQGFNQNSMPLGSTTGGNIPNNSMQYQQPKKNKAGMVIGIIVVLVMVAIALLVYMISKGGLFGSSPEKKLQKGIENIAKEAMEYNSGISEEIGLKELQKAFEDEKSHTNLNFALTVPGEESLDNLGIEIDAVSDNKNEQAKYNLGVSMSGMDLSVGDLFVSDNKLFISVPLLFEDVYSIDMTNFAEEFNNSAWAELSETTIPEDFEIELFANTKETEYKAELDELVEEYKDLTKDIVTYSINKEAKELYLNEDFAEYTGITITYDKDGFNELIESFKNDLMESEYYNSVLEQYSSMYTAEEAEEYADEYNEVLETILGVSLEEDFVINVYFDNKGRIVNASTPDIMPVSGMGDASGIGFDFTFSGAVRTLDEITGSIDIEVEDGVNSIEVNRFGVSEDTTYTEYIDVTLVDASGSDAVTFTYENVCDKEEKSFDINVSVESGADEIYFVADGYYTDITKGEGYTIQVDNASVGMNDENMFELTGSITSEITDEEIEVPEDSIDILDMDETEINAMLRSIR